MQTGYSLTLDESDRPSPPPCLRTRILYCVDATRLHRNDHAIRLVTNVKEKCLFWNFPHTGIAKDDEVHESLILRTFQSLRLVAKLKHFSHCEGYDKEFGLV